MHPVVFEGRTYSRSPSGRYWKARWGNPKRTQYLHRNVWESSNGPIPEGWHVHHIDGDPGNNALDNLECLPEETHRLEHREENVARGLAYVASGHLAVMQEKAKAWHASPEGREWHRQHGKDVWTDREPIARTCVECGKLYETLDRRLGRLMFCGRNCKANARRKSGVDDEERICACCGSTFRRNKYQPGRFCSATCRWKRAA